MNPQHLQPPTITIISTIAIFPDLRNNPQALLLPSTTTTIIVNSTVIARYFPIPARILSLQAIHVKKVTGHVVTVTSVLAPFTICGIVRCNPLIHCSSFPSFSIVNAVLIFCLLPGLLQFPFFCSLAIVTGHFTQQSTSPSSPVLILCMALCYIQHYWSQEYWCTLLTF